MRIIMIGGDKTVYFLARQFITRDYHVTIINRDPIRAKELSEHTTATVVQGEGTDVKRLEEAGARRADVVMALTSHDQDNLIACQLAQKIYGVPRTMALVNDPANEIVFEKLGISVVFSATKIIASLIEQQADFSEITTLIPLANGLLNVSDIRLDATSPAIGKSLAEIQLGGGSLIACIIRDERVVVPHGDTMLLVNDHLILISHLDNQTKDLIKLCGPTE